MNLREHERAKKRGHAEPSAAEKQLRERVSRLENIIEASEMGTFEWNVQTGRIVCNERYAALLGYTLAELDSFDVEAWRRLAHPDDQPRCTRVLERHFAGEIEQYDCECRMRHKDGSWVWVVARGRLCSRTADGKPLMMLGTQFDVHARKQAEEAARRALEQREHAQRRRDELVASIDGIVWEADAETFSFTFVSEQAERLLGYPTARWLEPGFWIERIHPDDRQVAVEYCQSRTRQMQDHRFDYRMRAADGRYLWLQDVVTVVAVDGRPAQLCGIMVDITARKLMENALRESEAFLRTIYHNSDVGICLVEVSEDGRLTFLGLNPAHERLLGGLKDAQFAGKSFPELLPILGREAMEYTEALYRRCIRERAPIENEVYVSDGPGQGWWLARMTPLFDATGGRVTRVVATNTRIDSRKRAEEALRASEERLRLAVQVSNVGILDWELGSNRVRYSREWKAQLGYEEHEIQSDLDEWQRRVHPDDLPDVQANLRRYLADPKGAHEAEFRMRHKDGTWRWIFVRAELVRDEGRPQRLVGCHLDVTERRQLEERLQHAQRMEAIGQLAGGVAHDFNNLLTVILGNAQLLREAIEPGSPSREETLSELTLAADRASALTRQLLTFSRRQRLQARPLDLNAVVQNLFGMLQRLIGEDVRLRLELAPAPLIIHADPGLLEQMLVNLAVNARDAMSGGGELTVETRQERLEAGDLQHPEAKPGLYARLRVTDSGTGIASEDLPYIFEPFFTTKEVGKGTGLGLATVFGIVQQHGGWVRVTSEVGRGTCFEISVPLSTHAVAKADSDHPSCPASVEPRERAQQTILVVEDEEPVRRLVQRILSRAGFNVLAAPSGVAALEQLEELKFEVDLVLTDLIMPGGISGQELGRRLRERRAELRVLYMSGYTGEGSSVDVPDRLRLPAGARLLNKPFTPALLIETVRGFLSDGKGARPAPEA